MKQKHLLVASVIVAAFAMAIASFAAFRPDGGPETVSATPAADARAVRDDSHRLTDPERSELTLSEFLDFECEVCGLYFPMIEQLKKEYGDRVTFVARYFPLPGHRNSYQAARAAEAAAQQGRFEDMYQKLFTTQSQWGEAKEAKDQVFRGYAQELGLDMAKYDTDVISAQTIARITADQRDGVGLKVQGTPTFFLDGGKVATPETYDAFKALIEQRLAEQ
nr:thioredoxin domain-containing protein [Streptomyces xanthophaeus]